MRNTYAPLLDRLAEIERDDGTATLTVQRGATLQISHLGKLFFPDVGVTKGDVMRYYVRIAPYILPCMKDRALSLKRFPNGVAGDFFFQQKAPPNPPRAVRVETLENEQGERQERIIGGSLTTLLYCTQLGAFEVNPWNARTGSLESPDFTVIDLDPGDRTPFSRVIEAAIWVKETLGQFGLHGAVKTSGATGIHVVIPLPTQSTEQTAERVAARIARTVAEAHPQEATIERSLKARGHTKVYVDAGQNSRGKTIACAYGVRATPTATVSTPLKWEELTDSLHPEAFTVDTLPQRLATIGDLWTPALRQRNSVRSVTKV